MEVVFKKPLPYAVAEKLKRVTSALIQRANELDMCELWLFGSLARGTFDYNSDVDLLVLVESNRKHASLLIEQLELREDLAYPKVDIVVRTKDFINTDILDFNLFVKRDKIVLWRK